MEGCKEGCIVRFFCFFSSFASLSLANLLLHIFYEFSENVYSLIFKAKILSLSNIKEISRSERIPLGGSCGLLLLTLLVLRARMANYTIQKLLILP